MTYRLTPLWAALATLGLVAPALAQTENLDDFVVSATRQARDPLDVPASVDKINQDTLEKAASFQVNLSETLTRVPAAHPIAAAPMAPVAPTIIARPRARLGQPMRIAVSLAVSSVAAMVRLLAFDAPYRNVTGARLCRSLVRQSYMGRPGFLRRGVDAWQMGHAPIAVPQTRGAKARTRLPGQVAGDALVSWASV